MLNGTDWSLQIREYGIAELGLIGVLMASYSRIVGDHPWKFHVNAKLYCGIVLITGLDIESLSPRTTLLSQQKRPGPLQNNHHKAQPNQTAQVIMIDYNKRC